MIDTNLNIKSSGEYAICKIPLNINFDAKYIFIIFKCEMDLGFVVTKVETISYPFNNSEAETEGAITGYFTSVTRKEANLKLAIDTSYDKVIAYKIIAIG